VRRPRQRQITGSPLRAEIEELEPRLLFSAEASVWLAGDAPGGAAPAFSPSSSMPYAAMAATQASTPQNSMQAAPLLRADQVASAPREIVFVDLGIEHADNLIADLQAQQTLGRALDIVTIGQGEDGIALITRTLAQSQGPYDAVHILSHGDTTGLTLGGARLDLAALQTRAQDIAGWGSALSTNADLMLYGCDLAAGMDGRLLIGDLALLTGADVAASDDLTGSSLLGGDWALEYHQGQVDAQVLFGLWQQPSWYGVLATYTVTSTVDNASAATTAGTLRWAITQANTNAGADTIAFNISGAAGAYGEYTITPYAVMPTITEAVTIDGSTQPGTGAAGHPLIVLDGNGGSATGLNLSGTADGTVIRGLVIRDFTSYGIYIAANSNGNTIVGNYIGSLNADGTDAGATERNDAYGIYNLGANLTIGGTTAGDRNVISGNGVTYNIYLGSGSDNAIVQGNYIGTNAAGTGVMANKADYGIMVESSSTNVTIGGSAAGAGNVISGFTTRNIWLTTTGTSTVQGNYIGTNATGTAALAGGGVGIYKDDTGSVLITGNVISGNTSTGVDIRDGDTTITGNIIGLNATGTAALANGGVGINIQTNDAVTIGGSTAAARNIISGNTGHGISVGTTATATHYILGNYIGVGSDGATLLGNGGAGVYIAASNVQVGGKNAGEGNIIAGNTGAGVVIASGSNNLVYRNAIYSNGGLGIDVGNDGVNANTLNDARNAPVITTAMTNGTTTTVTGSFESNAVSRTITIDFFSSPTPDASGYGEGRVYLGSVTITTNASTGDASFSIELPAVMAGHYITAVANAETSSPGVSEFSAAVVVAATAAGNRGKVIWNVNDQLYSWYASWNGSSFSLPAVTGINTSDDITMMLAAEAPTRNEVIMIGSADVSGKILALVWDGSKWTAPLTLPLASPAAAASQYNSFAVAYESSSGDAILVWDNGNTGTTGLSYAVWNGTSWSAVNTVTAPVSGEPYQMKLAAHPRSDEMVLVAATSVASNNQYAIVWNGSSWGNAQTLGSDSSKQYFEIDVAYESQSGRALVFYDNSASNQPTVQYRIWNGSTWSSEASIAAPGAVSGTAELYATAVASDASSNRIAIVAQTSTNNVWAAVWDGSTWSGQTVLTTTAPSLTDRPITAGVAFESKSGDLLVAYSKDSGPNVYYQTWTSGSGWSGELTGPSMGGTDKPYITKLYADPYTNTIMMGVQDSGSDLNFVAWNGSGWGTVTQLDGATGETYRQNFTYVWNRYSQTVLNNVAGDTLAYVKGDGARVIDQGYAATITDADMVGFNGGTLTVSFTAGSTAAQDVLAILNQGSGAGQIGLSGGNVTYGGVVIGTWTGGTSGSALVITLNANATAAAVGALASNITYQNTNGTTPSTTARTVRFALVDAFGVAATPRDASITVSNPTPGSTSVAIQEGVDGYTGTQDTYVRNGTGTSQGNNTTISFDGSGSSTEQGLIRFDSIFGNGPGQIPYGSTINSASLTIYAIEDGTTNPTLHRILGLNWDESSIWSGLGSGVQFNDVEASSSADSSVDASSPGYRTFTGLASTVQAWANGADNLGWVIKFDGNEWIIATSENSTVAWRPQLNITYTAPATTVIDLDPNNSTGATGPDSHKTFVENGGPVTIADSDASITDSDSTNLTGMTVTLTNPFNGALESLAATTTGTSITASYDSGTGVLTLSGTDTLARYQQVLRSITYNNLSEAPDTTTRFITIVATDGYTTSGTATAEISITAVNDAPTGSVSISGTPTQGQTLTASNTLADADGMGSVTYQWLRDGVNTGATGSTYTLTQADVGKAITVLATYTDTGGTTEAVSSAATSAVANINDAPTGSVSISGTATQGETLTASSNLADVDGMGAVTYQWWRDGSNTGATGTSYELSQADVGATITVRAVYTDGQGTAESVSSLATSTIANVNDAPTGSVSISGTATQGQTLTATNTLADADGLGAITYQWWRNGSNTGATGSTYMLTQADVGSTITVRAVYTDGQGTPESVDSTATSAIANVNDAPMGSVSISGTATQGQTLTASNTLADVDGLGAITYQWWRNGSNTGATGSTYLLTQADVGSMITVRAVYTDGQGTPESVESAATSAIANVNDAPTGSVSISGTATQGQTLTASNTLADVDGMGTVTYQWWRNGSNTGATGTTYVLTQADVGATLTVRAVYTDAQGTPESVDSAATSTVANVNDAPTGSVSISGTAAQGQTLTASNTLADVDGLGTITYQWWRNGSNTGATGTTYVLTQSDVGSTITVRAVYTDAQGTPESVESAATSTIANVNDAPTGSVSISGTAAQGQTLTASNTLADLDGLGTITYQWWRDGSNTGATGSTYVLTQSDVGSTLTVRAVYTDAQGTPESVESAATSAIANVNDAPTGSVSISGTAAQGQTLTASNSLADVDGLGAITYQWWRDGANTGATGTTYVLTQADVGSTLTVRAVYTDGQGTPESVESAATSAIANVNDAPTGSVSISGTATQGQTLTASNTLADVDGLGAITYQWWRDGSNTGATGSTYVLTQSDVGSTITVRAVYTDAQGTPESVESAATSAIANVNDAPTGSVSISGTATQGQTLTASNILADVDGLGIITYQWWRDGVNTGATGTTYALTQADVGSTFTVRAIYTDGQGTPESVDSAATSAIANVNDAPTGSVSISGTATQGQTLTASNTLADVDGLGTITYQWWRDGSNTGATGTTYVLTQADVGTTITVRAVYTDGQGTPESVESAATSAIANVNDAPTGSVSISGTATQGQTLTASHSLADVDGLGTITYQWWRDGVNTGATGTTYVLTQSDVGSTITVRAVYTDGQGTQESVDSAATSAIANINDTPTGSVSISGTTTEGQTLTASNTLADADGLGTITYQWWRDGVNTGATGTTYALTQADVGSTITVRTLYTDGHGTPESVDSAATSAIANVNDAPTGSVSISGTTTEGQTLTASNTLADADGLGTITYQWWRDGVNTGATGTTYALTQADVGSTITVRAIYTDGQGTPESVDSAATSAIANINDAPIGSVSISGTPTRGQTLTASNTLADVDGLGTITYAWWRDGVDTGVTGSTYLLSLDDVGATLTVRASYTDGQGTAEAVDSAPTATINHYNAPPVVSTNTGLSVNEGAQAALSTGTLQAIDADHGAAQLTYTVTNPPAHGRLELSTAPGVALTSFTQAQVDAGLVRYVHDGSETLADSLVFTVSDPEGATTTAATLNITVAPVNDAPTLSGPGTWSLPMGQPLSLLGAGNWQLADVDAGNQTLTVTLQVQFGTVTGNAGSTAVGITGLGTGTVHLSGTLAQLNSFMAGQQGARLVYAGVSQHLGDNMTVTLRDGHPGGTAAVQSSITQIVSMPDTGPELPDTPTAPAPAPSPASAPAPAPVPVATTPPPPAPEPPSTPAPAAPLTDGAPIVVPDTIVASRLADHLSFKPNASSSATGLQGTDAGAFASLLANTGGHNAALMAGLVPIHVNVSPGDVSLSNTAAPSPLSGVGDDGNKLLSMVSAETMQMSGTALSVGAVWWISRSATLLTSLLISTPVWRQLDPLPVFNSADGDAGDDDGDGDSALPERDATRRAEDLFARVREGEASEIS
jgi:hypothetical protein